MTISLVDAETLLAVDIGAVNTRAFLFDVAEGQYRFVAVGMAPTTASAPYKDVYEGVRLAVERLQEITGRTLLGEDEQLIVPALPDGSGADALALTLSAGPPLHAVAIGLLDDVSLESARHLLDATYASVAEAVGLNDRRRADAQIDAILRVRPDLIVVAGGTDGGATRSIIKLLEIVGLAAYLLPPERKPEVLFAGNAAMEAKVRSTLENLATVHTAANIRPAFDLEDLGPAQVAAREIYTRVRTRQLGGLQVLAAHSGGRLMPTCDAFGRMIRFISQLYDPAKGVLGVDLGASSTTLAAGFAGRLTMSVLHPFGIGEGLRGVIKEVPIAEISRWLPMHVSDDVVLDYAMHKSLYPASLPVTLEDLAIEQALAREVIRLASKWSARNNGRDVFFPEGGLAKICEPIIASGAVLAQAPTVGQSLIMLLDGLQPIGITTFVLDQNGLTAALGATAELNALLPVQILETGAYLNLGTVISPVSPAHYGTPILRMKVTHESGEENRIEVRQGTLGVVPLPVGHKAKLTLEPLHRTDVGFGRAGKGGTVRVVGGALGLVVDARGRPIQLPADASRRREMIKKWQWALGG
jgi:hypothetical protein